MNKWSAIIDKYIEEGRTVSGGCGASDEQKSTYQDQQAITNQLMQQSQQIFGASSSVFNDLMKTLSPIVAAGPGQKGYSPAEEAALKSEAITDTGEAYKHARTAVREHQAAQGGGTEVLPGGAAVSADINLANQGAAQTAKNLSQINISNYETGRQNFNTAVGELEQAPGVFNPATGAGSAATGAGSAQAETANQISQSNNSWMTAVSGALGGITGSLIAPGGWLGKKTP